MSENFTEEFAKRVEEAKNKNVRDNAKLRAALKEADKIIKDFTREQRAVFIMHNTYSGVELEVLKDMLIADVNAGFSDTIISDYKAFAKNIDKEHIIVHIWKIERVADISKYVYNEKYDYRIKAKNKEFLVTLYDVQKV